MTLYGRRRGLLEFDSVERAPLARAPSAGDPRFTGQSAADAEVDWTPHRKARPATHLLPIAEKWFDHLPPEVSPCALATQYPRIVNLLALYWGDRRACPAYFDDLLVDRRGGRQGFPDAVLSDLQRLRNYWYTGDAR